MNDIYRINDPAELLKNNTYPGRGLIMGTSADGKKAAAAYFIMGRSANSRNRIFAEENGVLYTRPYDASKVSDPSLIIYAAVRQLGNRLIVTNGDQTDTVYEGLQKGLGFAEALENRTFEPDAPNFTPRISALGTFENGGFSYRMNILKSIDAAGSACTRQNWEYPSVPGLGHFLHTYVCDGNPIPSFQGEPERIRIPDSADGLAEQLWDALNEANKISLYVRYTDIKTGETEKRIINKNK